MLKKLQREENKQLLREEILDKASALFENGNFYSMTMPEICDYVGVSVGMFYRLFASKNELISIRFMNDIENLVANPGGYVKDLPLGKQLKNFFLDVAKCYYSHGWEYLLFYLNSKNEPSPCKLSEMVCGASNQIIQNASSNNPSLQLTQDANDISLELFQIVKGISYVWATETPSCDLLTTIESILEHTINGFLS